MKILLAIFSCHAYNYAATDMKDWFIRTPADRVQGLRASWLKNVKGDYKIFKGLGGNRTPQEDEVFLSCPDDYHHSTEKLRALLRWALDNGYDYICKVDDDVYVYYDRLMANVPTTDYTGRSHGREFAPGFTYWLSRTSMEALVKSRVSCWAEDRWVGETLRRHQIFCTNDDRYHLVMPTKKNQCISEFELFKPNDWLTVHALSPDQMRRLYEHDNHSPLSLP